MKLSVIMPVARVDAYLLLTLKSVDAQTYRDFELVIVCDAGIKEKIDSILNSNNYSFSYKVIATKLKGVAFAANLALANCSGELIARWDSDDLCDSNRFSRQISELNNDPSLGVVGTRVQIIDGKGDINKYHNFKFYPDNKSIRCALKYRQPLLHSSIIFRSSILFKNNGYLYGHTSEDHELYIRIARDKSIVFKNIPDVITYYRKHSSQLSDIANQKNHFIEIGAIMFSEFLRTWNPIYIIGLIVNIPILRRLRYSYRSLLKFLND
jgi:glycosyltransferase involved in cell wall biosynthesis